MDPISEFVSKATTAELRFLLIGGNAMRLHGHLRNTVDVDFLIPDDELPRWKAFLTDHGYRMFHETGAFAQFELNDGNPGIPVDLMTVSPETWQKLRSAADFKPMGNLLVAIPRPEHLVALKLHAASNPQRSKPEQDWEDIRQLVRLYQLDPSEPLFKEVIQRYGREGAAARIEAYYHESDRS